MKKMLVALSLVMAAALPAAEHARNLRTDNAMPTSAAQTPQEGTGCAAPRSWGELKGISDRAVAFQDAAGTIRVLDAGPCERGQTQLIVKITRQ
jgi:hypothetical protein